MATYDLAYPGAAIDAILNTSYFLQEAGYIFQGSASEYSGTPSKRVWLIAPAGSTGFGLSSAVPQGSIGICLYNGTAWVGKVINVLTLDSEPTRNSQNGVTSGGVAATLDEIAGGIMETFASLLFNDETASADLSTKLSYAVKFSVSDVYQTVTHLNILAATTSKAGLMSAEDKAKVDSFLTGIRSMQFVDATSSSEQAIKLVEQLKWTVGGVQEVIDSITLLAATSSKAGLLSASDKAYIDALPATLTSLSNSISGALALMQSLVGYYVCDTAAGTAAKTVDATGYSLTNGGCIRIKMTNANTAANVTLNINSTGAKAIYYDGAQASSTNTWEAGEVLEVYYDGTQYQSASGGGGKAEKVKYDNTQSGLDAANVQEAIDVIAEELETEETRIKTGFQISTSGATTTWYATSIGFVKGRKYRIRVTASTAYGQNTSIILQLASQQFEGQKTIGSLPANTLVAEFDYYCLDDNYQYFCIYASGGHTVTYGVLVSDCLEMGDVVERNSMLLCPSATYVNFYMASSFVIASALLTRGKYYSVHSGQKFRIKAKSTKFATVLFLTSLTETLSNNQDLSAYKVGNQVTVDADTEKVVEVPATAGIMWVNVSSYYQGVFSNLEPVYVSIIDEGNTGFNDVTHSDNWVIKNGAFFGSNGKYVLHVGSAFKYIPVLEGEKYAVVTNTSNDCNYALMRSVPATIQHWTDIDAVGYGAIPAKQNIILEIPSGCNYLALSIANAYKDMEPIYVGKLSSDRNISDNVIIDTGLLNNVNTERILLFPVYGQSLAIGGDATPITTYCRFPKNCANTSNLALQFGQSLETSVYGLVESYVDFKGQENRTPAVRQNDKIASFSSGQGSTPISGLEKGTTLYSNLLSAITTAYNSRGQNKLIVPAFCWIQGEGDLDNGVQYYIDALSQLRADLDADIKAITGQTEDVHCIVYQTNQLCPASTSPWSAGKYESGSGGARFDGSVVAQWKLVRDSQYFHLSSPVYPMDFVVSPNGARIHISGMSQKYLGYYEGLAAKRLVDGHGDDIGLYVTSVTKVDNTHIRIALHAPCPPVVFDVENVEQVSHYGFSVITDEDTDIISDVAIERNNFGTTNILITTSADCSGAKLRYGYNGTKGYSGYKQGPRGNVRDSQGLWYKAQINNIDLPMHNWLMFFEDTMP